MFDKVDGFIIDYGGRKYLVLFYCEKNYVIFNRIRFFIRLKTVILYIVFKIM